MGRMPPHYVPLAALLLVSVDDAKVASIQSVQWLYPHSLALTTLSALYNLIYTTFCFDSSDLDSTEHGRVRGNSTSSTVTTS